MTIITRAGKGSSLTNNEMDSNLNSLGWRTAVIASSSIMSLTDEYNSFSVTGTTTIIGLTKPSSVLGAVVRFYFAGSSGTLTHGASLALPGNQNITWVNGDYAEFINVGGDNWRCTNYTPKAFSPQPLDEDDMASNSATHLSTQQSIKAYVDNKIVGFTISNSGVATGNPSGWTVAFLSNANYRITHPLGDTNFDVMVTAQASTIAHFGTWSDKTSTTVDVHVWKYDGTQDIQACDVFIRDRN